MGWGSWRGAAGFGLTSSRTLFSAHPSAPQFTHGGIPSIFSFSSVSLLLLPLQMLPPCPLLSPLPPLHLWIE